MKSIDDYNISDLFKQHCWAMNGAINFLKDLLGADSIKEVKVNRCFHYFNKESIKVAAISPALGGGFTLAIAPDAINLPDLELFAPHR